MKYTKQEIVNATKNATFIETYTYTDQTRRIHTDTVRYIGDGSLDKTEIEALPYDTNGEVDVDIELMDKEDYSNTILANSCERWEDACDEDDIIAVIVVR